MSQSSSLAAPTSTPPASARARSSPTSSTPASRRSARTAGRKRVGDRGVDQQRLGRVADAGALHLGVDGDPPRHLQVGVGVRRRRGSCPPPRTSPAPSRPSLIAAFRPSPPRGISRSTRPSWVASSASSSWPPPAEQQHRVLGQPRLGQRLADDRGQRPVGALGVAGAAQDDRVAALDRQRRAVDRHVRARLVDDGDDAERHPHLAQVEAALQGFAFELLADRVGERGDRAHARRPSPRPAPGSASAGRAAPRSARRRARRRGRRRSPRGSPRCARSSSRAVASRAASLASVGGARQGPRRALRGGAGLGDGGRGHGHRQQG